jgi:hypothetical protein
VIRYYRRFMTKQEHLVARHLFGTMKATKGRSDAEAQAESLAGQHPVRELLSSDREVLEMARDGYEAFAERTAKRILTEHSDEIYLNHCPRCGALAQTPKARQCRFCFHDWHGLQSEDHRSSD